jgi:hypothetical protein
MWFDSPLLPASSSAIRSRDSGSVPIISDEQFSVVISLHPASEHLRPILKHGFMDKRRKAPEQSLWASDAMALRNAANEPAQGSAPINRHHCLARQADPKHRIT